MKFLKLFLLSIFLLVGSGTVLAQSKDTFQFMDVFALEYASDPQISPDGKRIAYHRNKKSGLTDIWISSVSGGSPVRLYSENKPQFTPSWSPDGNWITFTGYTDVANRDQNSCEIFIMRTDGSDIRQLTDNTYCDYQPRWGN